MIYVMECGPIFQDSVECWAVLSFDPASRAVSNLISTRRQEVRSAMAEQLRGRSVACCASLGKFGRALGWQVKPVPPAVRDLACLTWVGVEHQRTLGSMAFTPMLEALLRACAGFLAVAPWRRFPATQALEATFEGRLRAHRVLAVAGAGRLPPSLVVLPDRAAFERVHRRDEGALLEDAVIVTLDPTPSPTAQALQLNYGPRFHPRLLRLRKGEDSSFSGEDLTLLVAALAATTSLGVGRPVGRASVAHVHATVVLAGADQAAALN